MPPEAAPRPMKNAVAQIVPSGLRLFVSELAQSRRPPASQGGLCYTILVSREDLLEPMNKLILSICLCLLMHTIASAMTVEEAYRAIPHRYTPFEAGSASMTSEESRFVAECFRLVNLAIVERVQTLAWFQSRGKQGSPFSNYRKNIEMIIRQLGQLNVPRNCVSVRQRVVEAIQDQKAYFQEWDNAQAGNAPFKYALGSAGPRHALVSSSSQKLHQAYGELMQLFPKERAKNQQAFFDHLCALDFI